MVVSARNWAGLSYALGKAKALADRLGGLENTDEYKKVLADLDAVELTFDDAILDVAALNAKIQEKTDTGILGYGYRREQIGFDELYY